MEQKLILIILFVFPFLAYSVRAKQVVIFDIRKYGAKPGADISEGNIVIHASAHLASPQNILPEEALLSAWKDACASPNASKIFIAQGKWMLSQARLFGPNKAPLELEVHGIVKAYSDLHKLPNKQWEWLTISYVNYFTLSGGGVFDGKGQKAWQLNDCHKNKNCIKLPINLSFNFINNSIIHDVTTKDSKNFHVNCIASRNVTFLRFTISAPGNSPNTDGLHLGRSSLINVSDSIIKTGDDCISMSDGMTQVHIQNVTCGPGHGISIGSLGMNVSEKDVSGIYVKNCTFIRTQNGVRVKTWPSAPATLQISDLRFEDLIMINATNPVIIDQQYCPHNLCNRDKPSLIKVSKVTIKNIKGTTSSLAAMTFSCSSSKPCENVEIGDIDLKYIGNKGPITTKCANIKPTFVGKQNPPVCATTSPSA